MFYKYFLSLLLSVIQLLYAIQSEQYKKNPKFLTIYFANYISFGGWIRVGGIHRALLKEILSPKKKKKQKFLSQWEQKLLLHKPGACNSCKSGLREQSKLSSVAYASWHTCTYIYIHSTHNNKAFKNCFSTAMRGLISIIPCS